MKEAVQKTTRTETVESNNRLINFALTEDSKIYDRSTLSERPPIPFDVISSYTFKSAMGQLRRQFELRTSIDNNDFIFSLRDDGDKGHFTFTSYTEDYGFAVVNLEPKDSEILFIKRASFIESVTTHFPNTIEKIGAHTSITPFRITEIDDCVMKILAHTENSYTKDELMRYVKARQPGEIFIMYEQLYKKDYFNLGDDLPKDRNEARARLFKAKFNKYLKTWVAVDAYASAVGYELHKKILTESEVLT